MLCFLLFCFQDSLKTERLAREKGEEASDIDKEPDQLEMPTLVKQRRSIDTKGVSKDVVLNTLRPRRRRNEKEETEGESQEKHDDKPSFELQTSRRRSRKIDTPQKDEKVNLNADSAPIIPSARKIKANDEESAGETEEQNNQSIEGSPKSKRVFRQRKSSKLTDDGDKEPFHDDEEVATPSKRESRPRRCNDKVEENKGKDENKPDENKKESKRRSKMIDPAPELVNTKMSSSELDGLNTPVTSEELVTPKSRERRARKSIQYKETDDEKAEEETPSLPDKRETTNEVHIEKIREKPGPKHKNRTPKISQSSDNVDDTEKLKVVVKDAIEKNLKSKIDSNSNLGSKENSIVNILDSCQVVVEDISADLALKRRKSITDEVDKDLHDFKEDKNIQKKKKYRDTSDNDTDINSVKSKTSRKRSLTRDNDVNHMSEDKTKQIDEKEEIKAQRRDSKCVDERDENRTTMKRNSSVEHDGNTLRTKEKESKNEEIEVSKNKRRKSHTEVEEKETKPKQHRRSSHIETDLVQPDVIENKSNIQEEKEDVKSKRKMSREEDKEKVSMETNKEETEKQEENKTETISRTDNNSLDEKIASKKGIKELYQDNKNKEEDTSLSQDTFNDESKEKCIDKEKEIRTSVTQMETSPIKDKSKEVNKSHQEEVKNIIENKEEKTSIIEEKFYNIKTKKLKEIIHTESKQNKVELCKNNDLPQKDAVKAQTAESIPAIQEEKKMEITPAVVDQSKSEDVLKNQEYYERIHKKKSMANLYSNDLAKYNTDCKKDDRYKDKEEKSISLEAPPSNCEEKQIKHYDLPIRKASKVILEDITKTIVDSEQDSIEPSSLLPNTSVIKSHNIEFSASKPVETDTVPSIKPTDVPQSSTTELYPSDSNSYSVRKEECTSSTELVNPTNTSILPQPLLNQAHDKKDIEVIKTVSKNSLTPPTDANTKHSLANNSDLITHKNSNTTTLHEESKSDKYTSDSVRYKDTANKNKEFYSHDHSRTTESIKVVESPSKVKHFDIPYDAKYGQADSMSNKLRESEPPNKQRSDSKVDNEPKYREFDARDYEASVKQRDIEKFREVELRYLQKEVDARNRMREVDYYRSNVPDMRIPPVDVDQYNKNKSSNKRSLDDSVNKIKEIDRLKKPEVRPCTDDSIYRNMSEWNRSREYSLPLDTTRYLTNPNEFANNWNRNIVTNSRLPENIIESNKILNESWKLDENYQLASKSQRETERKKAIDETLYRKQSSRGSSSSSEPQQRSSEEKRRMGGGAPPPDSSEKCYSPVIRAEPSSTHKTPSPVQVTNY